MSKEFTVPRFIICAVLLIALILLVTSQSNPPFLLLMPIILFTLLISIYLYRELQKDHEEDMKQNLHYIHQEQEAQKWLHKSFVPKARKLAKKDIKEIILISGISLMSFIFIWSFFVSGLSAAIINTLISFVFFVGFIIYALYTPKEFTHIFKHMPKRFQHHSKNDWVHAYLLLFPFAIIGFFIYSLTTTGEGVLESLYTTVIFLFSYTFIFICLYCLWYLYKEYQMEMEQSAKKTAKKILDE